jgi:SAM-dependent methyltransferase
VTLWERVARKAAGDEYAVAFAQRFRDLAAAGQDVHGEATCVEAMRPPPARVLDAGCGTGRVAARLAERGYDVVGVDVDPAMLDVARADAPDLDWRQADLSDFDLGETFDVVVLAGNIVPLLEPGTLTAAAERLAAHLAPDGVLICGFGYDEAHLPPGAPVTPLASYDEATAAAGVTLSQRWSTWDGEPFAVDGGYAVSIHRRGADG